MTLQKWKAQMGRGGAHIPEPVAASAAPGADDETPDYLGARRHANSGDDYTSAFEGELGRTAKEAGIGLLKSPIDLVKGAVNTVLHPLDTLMGLGKAVAHPVDTAMNLARNPREAGSQLGQLLLAPKVPGAAEAAITEGPGIAGRGLSAVGRGAEAVGNSGVLRKAQKLAPLELITGHPLAAAVSAAAPEVLTGGGRLAQRGGAALEGLTEAARARKGAVADPFAEAAALERQSTEVPGSSYKETPGPMAGPLEDTPFTHEAFVENLRKSAGAPKDVPNGGLTESDAFKGLQTAVRKSNLSPAQSAVESFLENDPQAAVGGEGRTAGGAPSQLLNDVFGETTGDLNGVRNGTVEPHISPSALDELSQMSGRALSPDAAQALLNKYRNVRVGG